VFAVVYPKPQPLQVPSTVAPATLEYFPMPQSVHVDTDTAPTTVLYFPALQFVQIVPVLTYVPAGQALRQFEVPSLE
jgi:hypothetical protein